MRKNFGYFSVGPFYSSVRARSGRLLKFNSSLAVWVNPESKAFILMVKEWRIQGPSYNV